MRGQLSHKSQQVFEALLASYHGSYAEVLKHVQVERYFISQRYRVGAVTVGPQMSVDAGERQITADRSLAALPPSLQAITLYEAKGELVDAAGGILEFSDLLKRPLDAFKYLQLSIETGEVSLTQQNVHLNCVMIGERERGPPRRVPRAPRVRELPRATRADPHAVPAHYARASSAIYDAHDRAAGARATSRRTRREIAAMFAVLTRMRKPSPDRYARALGAARLGRSPPLEKMDLYAHGRAPERLEPDAQKLLRANIELIYERERRVPDLRGPHRRVARARCASRCSTRRSRRTTSASRRSRCSTSSSSSASARTEFEWLQQDPLAGGYHDTKQFRESLRRACSTTGSTSSTRRAASSTSTQYAELFERYVQHVSVWVKKERIRNKVTGEYEEPDEKHDARGREAPRHEGRGERGAPGR